jgi:hypothetical protein
MILCMSPRAVRTFKPTLAALLLCAVAAGCAVDQRKEVGIYRRVLDGDGRVEKVVYHPGDVLTLDAALRLANQDNERIAMAGEDYLQALINKDRAASTFLPTVSLDPS